MENILSFIPLIMIILFIVRLASGAGRKKTPPPINSIPHEASSKASAPAQKKPQQASGAAAGAAAKTVENRPANADRFSQAATNLPAAAAAKPDPGTSRKAREASMFRPAEEMFKTEQKKSSGFKPLSETGKTAGYPAGLYKSPRKKIDRLPELKKAVIWAEILGRPKGLD